MREKVADCGKQKIVLSGGAPGLEQNGVPRVWVNRVVGFTAFRFKRCFVLILGFQKEQPEGARYNGSEPIV